MSEEYSKREWVSRAALKLAPYIDYPSNHSDQQIVGIAIYDRQMGEAAFISILEPSDDVVTMDITQDLIHDLQAFQGVNRELFYGLSECATMETDNIVDMNDATGTKGTDEPTET